MLTSRRKQNKTATTTSKGNDFRKFTNFFIYLRPQTSLPPNTFAANPAALESQADGKQLHTPSFAPAKAVPQANFTADTVSKIESISSNTYNYNTNKSDTKGLNFSLI